MVMVVMMIVTMMMVIKSSCNSGIQIKIQNAYSLAAVLFLFSQIRPFPAPSLEGPHFV
jgi:hypothetical protein